jgi:hypothetical protein
MLNVFNLSVVGCLCCLPTGILEVGMQFIAAQALLDSTGIRALTWDVL